MNINPLSANPTKWSNTLNQFADEYTLNTLADELFECVWPICEIGSWRVK